MLDKIIQWLEGKKTFITAILIGLGAAAQALGYVVPEWVWALLGALGLGSVRLAISKK